MNGHGRLVTAEVNLDAFSMNYFSVIELLSETTRVMVVVKANAYGHGIVPIGKKAQLLGADYLGVACLFEAKQLRQAGITLPILLLNYTDELSLEEALDLDLTINVMDLQILKSISSLARKKGKRAKVHVKVDSGMNRLGVMPDEGVSFITTVAATEYVYLEGIFTHFADADGEDLAFTHEQLAIFTKLIKNLNVKGIRPPLVHAANSAAILRIPESHLTMVRAGKILYGPLPKASYELPFISEEILTLKTHIVQIRSLKIGESVGYGRAFVADHDMRIASIPIGYADGFRRFPNFGEVLVRGKRAQLVGRVSMDQSSIDISNVDNVFIGDEVIVIGKQGMNQITTQEVADRIGTINYEVLTSLAERVTRVYKDRT